MGAIERDREDEGAAGRREGLLRSMKGHLQKLHKEKSQGNHVSRKII